MDGTGRLILRRPVSGDLAAFFAIFGDPATNAHNPSGPCADIAVASQMLGMRIAHWPRYGFGQWAIATRERPDAVIGFGGLAWRDYGGIERLNLGYRFATAAWGRGYATELGAASLAHAFGTLREPAVYALVRPSNIASIRVLEKIGMRRAGDLDDVPGHAHSLVYVATHP
ncbi:MAG TPA: GNAT family N-acetyltransferase [Tahibacter sp.]|nr:GNAT family N-acetyltransferase [Tahibacter sp.]